MRKLLEELRQQRWDDHRFYHHSRVNQFFHLISSLTFVAAYVLLFIQPVVAVLASWLFGMMIRQAGHFFFEPKAYDETSGTTHAEREAQKIGYNLRRKVVLLSLFAFCTVAIYFDPTAFGLLTPPAEAYGFLDSLSKAWLSLAVGAVAFRTLHLFVLYSVTTGLVWALKIVTDPFHDILLYWKSPLHLLQGQKYDYHEYAEPKAA